MSLPKVESISADEFSGIRETARVLEKDGHGEKVLLTSDNKVIKLFRRKHLISSAAFKNYARRFAENSEGLSSRGIPTVTVERLFLLEHPPRDGVQYQLLEGETLADLLEQAEPALRRQYLNSFIDFVAFLHDKGVYFRSLHLSNVLIRPDGSLALIDISDLKLKKKALNLMSRVRNFRAFLRRPQDEALIREFGPESFVEAYAKAAGISLAAFLSRLRWIKDHPLNNLLKD